MNNKLDVFEILGVNETKGQEQQKAPDLDFNEAIKRFAASQEKKIPAPAPAPKKVKETAEPKKKPSSVRKKQNRKWLLAKLAMVLIVVLLFFNFVVSIQKVSGISMAPTFEDGDKVAVFLLCRNYQPGDVVVFKAANDKTYMKRIVAGANDTVNITETDGLIINGRTAEESYIYTETRPLDESINYPILLSEDTYFVLGDNRTSSTDSRNLEIGTVKKSDIIGKVIFCFRKL